MSQGFIFINISICIILPSPFLTVDYSYYSVILHQYLVGIKYGRKLVDSQSSFLR